MNVYILNKNNVCGNCVLGEEFKAGDAFLFRSKRNKFVNLGYSENLGKDGISSLVDNYLGGNMFTNTMKAETKGFFK